MAKRNTSIAINGKYYNALTGELLASPVAPEAVKLVTKSIDGVVAPAGHTTKAAQSRHTPHAKAAPKRTAPTTHTAKPTKHIDGVHRGSAAHVKPRKAHASKTLMRHAVAKPKQTARRPKVHAPLHAPSHAAVRIHAAVVPKTSIYGLNQARALRASAVTTHPRIAKFAHQLQYDLTVALPQTIEHAASVLNQAVVIPAPTVAMAGANFADITPAPRSTAPNDVFERALQRATSHEQPVPVVVAPEKRRLAGRLLRRRMVSFGAGAMAVVALAGFVSISSAESVKFRVATRDAGFEASMPSFTPVGYKVTSIKSVAGYVGVRYEQTNADGQKQAFVVAQKPTPWSDDDLVANIADSSKDASYRTVATEKNTVYAYGSNQAAWINNGILYQIIGNSNLASTDIARIASSL